MNNISTELCKLRLEVRMNKVGTKDWFNSEEKVLLQGFQIHMY